MKRKLVFTIGNSLMGDDAAGPLLAQKIRQAPLPEWDVLDGGFAPENYLHKIREMSPQQILLIDTAEMGLPPGEIRAIPDETIADPFFMTTHSLPLTYLIGALREIVPEVGLVGIQPEVVAFGYPVSSGVKHAIEQVYGRLERNEGDWEILPVEERNEMQASIMEQG
jgi:hydrogenase 3 maturation protease